MAAAPGPQGEATFEACATFGGERPGWAFKRGPMGLGYYRDAAPKPLHRIFWLLREGSCTEVLAIAGDDPAVWREVDVDGNTPLHWGALIGNIRLVRAGLAAGLPVDARAANLQTPLMWATSKGHVAMARALLEAGADPCAGDSKGATPAIVAIQNQQATMLLLFFCRGPQADVMAGTCNKGCGLAHWAAFMGDLAALKLLDHFGADFPGAVDGEGKTPLHRAAAREEQSAEVLEFLLDKHVDPARKDGEGRTCVDVAANLTKRNVEKMLAHLLKVRGLQAATGAAVCCDVEAGAAKPKAAAAAAEQGDFQSMMRFGPAVFWLACVSLTVFQYLVELRTFSWSICPVGACLFELGVPLSLMLFAFVSNTDPGKVAPRPQKLAIDELAEAFKAGTWETAPRLCSATWVIKGARSKYCKHTGRCVDEFDHFCGWLNTAIGKGNHRSFIALTAAEVFTQLCYVYLCVNVAGKLVPYKGGPVQWGLSTMAAHPLLALVTLLQAVSSVYILGLLRYQLAMIFINITTNEYMNAIRYGYAEVVDGRVRWKTSPFDKGGPMANCLDFWWFRRRAEYGPREEE